MFYLKELVVKRKKTLLISCVFVVFAFIYFNSSSSNKRNIAPGERVQPVRVIRALNKDVPMFLQSIGTAKPTENILVKSRVDGQLMEIYFTEGSSVKAGDLLALIDERPYKAKLLQAKGTYDRDLAKLKEAQIELKRFRKLFKENAISDKQLKEQESLVAQYQGTILADKASIDEAELQLSFCKITAPASGKVGLKNVDVGNIVRTSDTEGIVLITPVEPIYVVFSIVEKDILKVIDAQKNTTYPLVEAWNQDNTSLIENGKLIAIDNQIDTSTGTVKAKAEFKNKSQNIFPGQFVNTKLLVHTFKNALVVPTSAVQRRTSGFFVFMVESESIKEKTLNSNEKNNKESTEKEFTGNVKIVPIETIFTSENESVIKAELPENSLVVTDGVDRLREDSAVFFRLKNN